CQRVGGEIEQPRSDDAAPAPQLGDVGNRELVARFLRKLVGSGVAQNVESLGVCLHEPVLDAVVNHLDEMTGARRAAMQVALLGRSFLALPAGCARDVARAGRKRLPYG